MSSLPGILGSYQFSKSTVFGSCQPKTSFFPELPIKGSRLKLTHVLINLIKKAVKAMAHCSEDQARVNIHPEGDEKGVVRLTIRDSGMGVTEKALKKLFTHGFTTNKTVTVLGFITAPGP